MKNILTVAFLSLISLHCLATSDYEDLRLKAYNYRYGIGCEQDYYTSRNFYQIAANQGDVFSEVMLGVYHMNGWGCVRSQKTALEIFEKHAPTNGHAMFWLGWYNLNSWTSRKDKADTQALMKSMECFEKCLLYKDNVEILKHGIYGYAMALKKLADDPDVVLTQSQCQEYYTEAYNYHDVVVDAHPDNLLEFADMLSNGKGCKIQPDKALAVLRLFINNKTWGDYRKGEAAVSAAVACWNLDKHDEAREWLRIAAEDYNWTDGKYQYAKVLMLNKQYEDAIYWFSSAAEDGELSAMIELFKLYMSGGVVDKDEEAGLYWLERVVESNTLKVVPEYEAWYRTELAKLRGEETKDPHPGDLFKDSIVKNAPKTAHEHLQLAKHYLKAYDIYVHLFLKHYTSKMTSGIYSDEAARKSAHELVYFYNKRQYQYCYTEAYKSSAVALGFYQKNADRYSDELLHSLATMAKAAYLLDKYDECSDCIGRFLTCLKQKIEREMAGKDSRQRKAYWDQWSTYMTNFIPSYAMDINLPKSSEQIYDAALLYKGLLLNYDKSLQGTNLTSSWRDVRASLKKDEAAVEFVKVHTVDLNEPAYVAVVVTPGCKSPALYQLFGEGPLHAVLSEKEYYTTDYLYNIVWAPMQKHLAGAKKIYFAPDGILYNIALESIPSDGRAYVGDTKDFYRISSTRELLNRTGQTDNYKDIALLGGVDFGESKAGRRSGVKYLEHSLEEVDAISAMMSSSGINVTRLTADKATELAVTQSNKADIIHFATHGYFWKKSEIMLRKRQGLFNDAADPDNELLRSGLLLSGANVSLGGTSAAMSADGILTAQEISVMDLSETDLVVLSACETALGKVSTDGVYGLQRGFKMAGADSILMTLWKVDDKATSLLMQKFYESLLAGNDKHGALESARKHMRESLDYSNPKYWAGFILLDGIN